MCAGMTRELKEIRFRQCTCKVLGNLYIHIVVKGVTGVTETERQTVREAHLLAAACTGGSSELA